MIRVAIVEDEAAVREQLREVRGSEAAMVFQEPNSVLNPVYTIGWQIILVWNRGVSFS